MSFHWKEIARQAHAGAETETLSFGDAVRLLTEAGLDGYTVDYRRSTRTYYMPSGEALELATKPTRESVAAQFDVASIEAAIREAQTMAEGYTYAGFCEKAVAAGCAGYLVSLIGRRVLYFGRTGEIHVEYFPGAKV